MRDNKKIYTTPSKSDFLTSECTVKGKEEKLDADSSVYHKQVKLLLLAVHTFILAPVHTKVPAHLGTFIPAHVHTKVPA